MFEEVEVSTGSAPVSHGFSQDEVEEIQQKVKEIAKRDLYLEPVSLDESLYFYKAQRIKRFEEFAKMLSKEKPAKEAKAPKEPKPPKIPKVPKKVRVQRYKELLFKELIDEKFTEAELEEFAILRNEFGEKE